MNRKATVGAAVNPNNGSLFEVVLGGVYENFLHLNTFPSPFFDILVLLRSRFLGWDPMN